MIWNLGGESIEREYIFKEYEKNVCSGIAWWQDTAIHIGSDGEQSVPILSEQISCHLAMTDDCKCIEEWFAFL